MASQMALRKFYINVAVEVGKLSYCQRKKVGCVIVKGDSIISMGYNGTPHGLCNDCEDENDVSVPEVIHAEINALAKVAKSSFSSDGATMYVSLSPCHECVKSIIQSGIARLFYKYEYRDVSSLLLLNKCGIEVYTVLDDGSVVRK